MSLAEKNREPERPPVLPTRVPTHVDPADRQRSEARQRRWMALLTALCAVALGVGWLVERFEFAPSAAQITLAIVAFGAGGGLSTARALRGLYHGTVSIDLLMVTAAVGAAAVGAWIEGGILLFLFSLSSTLEQFALHRTRRAIEALLDLRPAEATVRRPDGERRIPAAEIEIGDVVVVRPGERLPADGVVVVGTSSVDQSPMTGESIPVDKTVGDAVFAGTLNQEGAIEIRATRLPGDTTLQRIIRLVEEAQNQKASSQRFTDWFGQRYTIGVFGAALLAVVIPWLVLGNNLDAAFYRAMTILVVASPCAVVISIPAAILSAIARGARDGVLFKGGAHLERAATITAVAFDKTGTLTVGRPTLTAVRAARGIDPDTVLRLAASGECRSEHPLARAVTDAARSRNIFFLPCASLEAIVGHGIRARLESGDVWVGKKSLMMKLGLAVPADLDASAVESAMAGQTVMYVADSSRVLGIIAAADTLRPTARETIERLRCLGIKTITMLTGDNETVARAIASQLGISHDAELLPEDKLRIIQRMRGEGEAVAMVGDGINDAPSLATATLGVSLGGASTDVALETADLVLMGSDLRRLPEAIGLARRMNQIIRQNLVFAFSVMALLLIATFVEALRLPFAVVGHEGSTVLVILNGLRLLSASPSPTSRRGSRPAASA